jgi:RNA polymerase sigma factor (sigma-70 family)
MESAMRTGRWISFEDAFGAGAVGLLVAAKHYDPDCGFPFNGYARKHIRGRIINEARFLTWKYHRVGSHGIRKFRDRPERRSLAKWKRMGKPDRAYSEIERRELCEYLLSLLDLPRSRGVMRLHFLEGLTLGEIGRRLGCTESNVCVIVRNAVRKIRQALCSTESAT